MKFVLWSSIAFGCLAVLIGTAVGFILATTPRPLNLGSCITTEMFHVRLCPSDRDYVRLKDISNHLKDAVIVSEDGNFYNHQGIDWFEVRESFDKNWQRGEFARGGSTITQQLAKNVYLNQEKSLLRKVREAIITIQIEDHFSKDEILEKYLNVVELGDHLYGAHAASEFYFHKTSAQLSVAEGAFLAFLLPSPTRYSASFRYKKLTTFARSRMREIVRRMWRYKKISEEDEQEALAEVDHFFGQPEAPVKDENDESTDQPTPEEQTTNPSEKSE